EDARARGDLFAEVLLRLHCGCFLALAANDPDRAEQDLSVITDTWAVDRFVLQHAWRMVSAVDVALYRGDGERAWSIVEETWPKLQASQLLRVQSMRVRAKMARGRAALATGRLDVAARETREVAREAFPLAQGWARVLEAGLLEARGDVNGASSVFDQAAADLDVHDACLWCWTARRRRGELVGGEEGAALVAEAERSMKAEGITDPTAFARIFVVSRPASASVRLRA